jgi:hypothetical protein
MKLDPLKASERQYLRKAPVVSGPGLSFCQTLNMPQIARQEPDQPTVTIHLAGDAAIACTDHHALRRRISPEAIVAHEFNPIARLECIEDH